jgi:hypothetical protein
MAPQQFSSISSQRLLYILLKEQMAAAFTPMKPDVKEVFAVPICLLSRQIGRLNASHISRYKCKKSAL